jgi:hypothetical protein
MSVGAVGNAGRVTAPPFCFSKSPEFHNRDLENPHRAQPRVKRPFSLFSHFSFFPTGATGFFLFFKDKFPLSQSLLVDLTSANGSAPRREILQSRPRIYLRAKRPGIQRKHLFFHAPGNKEMNTIKRNKRQPVFVGLESVIE